MVDNAETPNYTALLEYIKNSHVAIQKTRMSFELGGSFTEYKIEWWYLGELVHTTWRRWRKFELLVEELKGNIDKEILDEFPDEVPEGEDPESWMAKSVVWLASWSPDERQPKLNLWLKKVVQNVNEGNMGAIWWFCTAIKPMDKISKLEKVKEDEEEENEDEGSFTAS